MSRGKSNDVRHAGHRLEAAGARRRAARAGRGSEARRGAGTRFVAAHAAGVFARLDGEEALHAFDGKVVLVERDEEEAAQRRQFDVGRAVRLDGHSAQDAFEGEGAAVADGVHAARVMDGHGQGLQDQQLLDLARA